ncbi:hypothetical protein EJ05DRAFT_512233 [Pseudovirgaria hyperparasitica]|uniref:Uncharacterized protein n=1 Tax=Pseudovirgaria hyperparasitica TaxID=470096 RepID=A0A6A6W387_9PEZI|nr:uncharacterized protein EJ05DRAFT_512233 [Pseudovirgaria hyperparasitica]KAF2756599.1 hypothetical protein EJ05DRAFT_512233 [Pseudovirgaria hyperparasitica]
MGTSNFWSACAIFGNSFENCPYSTYESCPTPTSMLETSLCFKEARDARHKGDINLDEYVNHIVAHYGTVKHDSDVEGKRPWFPIGFEHEVREIVLREDHQAVNETDMARVYDIFMSAFKGDSEIVRIQLKDLEHLEGQLLRPLVAVSTQEGFPKLFNVCLEKGFQPTEYIDQLSIMRSARRKHSLEWLEVLFNADFRNWKTNRENLCQWNTWSEIFRMGPECVRWWIDRGCRTKSARGLFEHDSTWPGVATFSVLLEEFGIDWFKDSGTLQIAARNKDLGTVALLLNAGADVNEEVTDWSRDVREHRAAPLTALHEALYARSEETVRYLVEHGARLPRKYVADPYNLVPKDVKVLMGLVESLGAIGSNTQL